MIEERIYNGIRKGKRFGYVFLIGTLVIIILSYYYMTKGEFTMIEVGAIGYALGIGLGVLAGVDIVEKECLSVEYKEKDK